MTSIKSNLQSKTFWYRILIAVGLIMVFVSGLVTRRAVLNAQVESVGLDLPFSLESALHYRRTKILFDRGELPEIDHSIQYPEGVRIAEIDSIASEPFYVQLARLFPEKVSFHDRMRWIEAGWFCLSMPLLMLALRVWTGSWVAGFLAAMIYAFSISSVLRSTGQEISRENFAIPWLIGSYIFCALYFRGLNGVLTNLWGILSGVMLAMSLIAWDMIQYVIAVWTFGLTLHVLARGSGINRSLLQYVGFLTMAVLVTGLLHPYYRFHGLVFSPLTVWMCSVFACAWYMKHSVIKDQAGCKSRWAKRWGIPLAIILLPMVCLSIIGSATAYGSSYEHFAQLLFAKIRFLNVKPSDPSLMSFYQRIMWVPSLHSANWVLTNWMFPFTLWLSCLIAVVALVITRKRPDSLINHWLLLFVVSGATYVLFVRFHVFVGLSCAVLCGWIYGKAARHRIGWRVAIIALLLLATAVEASHTVKQRQYMGRPNVYYEELKELSDWLQQNVAPDAVLANMGVSAYAAAYGKCAIVLHPKFEDPSIRERLKEYGELLFGADEKALRDWMMELGVEYLIYSHGEFARQMPEYQMRYFVNMLDPAESVPAKRFERNDDSLNYFKKLWGNHKYSVYRAFSLEDEERAAAFAQQAIESFEEGKLLQAEALALKALSIDTMQAEALRVMRHVGSLHEQGYQHQGVSEQDL